MEIPKRIGKYSILGALGKGGYGKVFLARDLLTLETVAIKVSSNQKLLSKEYKILSTLNKTKGFMKVYEYGSANKADYIVMENLGKSLYYCNGDNLLSLKSVSAIGIEVISKLEILHKNFIIHRDVKPQQFLLSPDKTSIVLVDYGLATYFFAQNEHRAFKLDCPYKGSPSFASINCHMGFRQSRRDDLESLIYSLVYLIKGGLPWNCNPTLTGAKKWKCIFSQKIKISEQLLFKDCPPEFETFWLYIRKLKYDQTPDYLYLKSLLSKFIVNQPLAQNFDWIQNPNFNTKFESFVEFKDNKSSVYIKKGGFKLKAKRRNGLLGISFDFSSCTELNEIDSTQDDLKSPQKVSYRRKRIKKADLFMNNSFTMDKFAGNSRESFLNIPKISFNSTNCMFLTVSSSLSMQEIQVSENNDECLTTRGGFPELSNRETFTRHNKVQRVEEKEEPNHDKCTIC